MKKIILTAVLATVLMAAQASAEPVLLRYKHTVGDQLLYVMNATGDGEVKVSPNVENPKKKDITETPINMSMKMSMESIVTDTRENGDATLETRIKRYSLTQNGTEILGFDEGNKKKEKSNPLADMMKSKFSMVITPRGEIKEVKGLDAFSKLNQQMDFSQILSQMQQTFPEKPVNVGDKWKQTAPLNKNNPMSGMETEYEFVGFEQAKGLNCVKLKMKVNGDFSRLMKDIVEDSLKKMGGKLEGLEVKTSGELFFEPQAGVLVAAEFSIAQKMVMTMKSPKAGAPDLKMVMKMNLEGVYELE